MNSQRHPDIEIYLKNVTPEQVEHWLQQRAEQFQKTGPQQYQVTFTDTPVAVALYDKVAGKAWSSLWFKSAATPWATDLDCAREASQALGTQVRCSTGGWQEAEQPEPWWKVEQGEETLIDWPSR